MKLISNLLICAERKILIIKFKTNESKKQYVRKKKILIIKFETNESKKR